MHGLLCSQPFVPCHLSWFMWGHWVLPAAQPAPFSATLSPALSVYLCANVGPQGLLVVRLLDPLVPHSASLSPTMATRVLSALVPVSAPPTGLDVCFFFIYLVSDFLAVRFSVSSGFARRCSVSTYAAILVLPSLFFITNNYVHLLTCLLISLLTILFSTTVLPCRSTYFSISFNKDS